MRRLLPALTLTVMAIASLFALNSCGDSNAKNDGPIPVLDAIAPINTAPIDAKSKEIEAVTGAHTRIVWTKQQNPDKTDAHGNGTQFKLYGFDTRDGKGPRTIFEENGNYARPLLTPDGKRIVFNDKGTYKDKKGRKFYTPSCYVVNWDGSGLRELGEGYADEVWADPKTGKLWVYVVSTFAQREQSAMEGAKLERFLLDDPATRETVFNKATSPNNIMVSRDGSQIGGLFPWSYGGRLDVNEKEWVKTKKGCWTGISPDNTYVTWTFDGAHKNLWMVPMEGEMWEVPVNTHPEARGREVYHPRWSNHPLFFTISGPYPNGTRNVEGKKVQIYIGEFTTNLAKVKRWVKVTEDHLADVFPDVWIAGGEQFSLPAKIGPDAKEMELVKGEAKTQLANQPKPLPKAEAAVPENGLVFLWINNDERNQIGKGETSIDCKVEISGRARFGPNFEMRLGGGQATVSGPTSSFSDRNLAGASGATLAFVAAAETNNQAGAILEFAGATVGQDYNSWYLQVAGKKKTLGSVTPRKAEAFVLTIDANGVTLRNDANLASLKKSGLPALANTAQMQIGDGAWDGGLAEMRIYNRAFSEQEVSGLTEAMKATTEAWKAPERITFTGKLKQLGTVGDVDGLGQYRESLVPGLWEVVSVEDGNLEAEEVAVFHWSIIDMKRLSQFPPAIGETKQLVIERFDDQPQFENANTADELWVLEPYYDVITPAP
ncbi:MAG: hypothetical protein AAGA58_19965 [Verrucomicrobiota bacterium]